MSTPMKLALTIAAALLMGVPAAGQCCDIPVWKVARSQWFPEMYYLYHLYQEGIPNSKEVSKGLTAFEEKELAEVNVAVIPLNLSKKIIDTIDRVTMDEQNVRAYPYFAAADAAGARIAAGSDAAELAKALEEVRKTAERRKKPAPVVAKVYGLWKGKLPATGAAARTEQPKVAAALKDTALIVELIDVDAPTPAQQKVLDSLGVVNLPVLLMVGPDRAPLAKLAVDTKPEKLRPLFFSPKRQELVKKVLDSTVTFAIVTGSDAASAKAARDLVTKAIAEARKWFKDSKLSTLEIAAADAGEAVLLKNLGLKPQETKSTIVPVFGLGKAMFKVQPPAKMDPLLEAVAAVNGPCSCTFMPGDFGFDLLLKLPEPKAEQPGDGGRGEGEPQSPR